MSLGQFTGLFAMACWWGAAWSLSYWPTIWWVPSVCLVASGLGGAVFMIGWMLDHGGVTVEKIES